MSERLDNCGSSDLPGPVLRELTAIGAVFATHVGEFPIEDDPNGADGEKGQCEVFVEGWKMPGGPNFLVTCTDCETPRVGFYVFLGRDQRPWGEDIAELAALKGVPTKLVRLE